ncbi:unnamed protein product [Arctogadus glacialis]
MWTVWSGGGGPSSPCGRCGQEVGDPAVHVDGVVRRWVTQQQLVGPLPAEPSVYEDRFPSALREPLNRAPLKPYSPSQQLLSPLSSAPSSSAPSPALPSSHLHLLLLSSTGPENQN